MSESERILDQKGLRITPMRLLVLERLLVQETPSGLNALQTALPRADRTTIYRTLKTFSENGIVHPIENGNTEVKYALCRAFCTASEHLDKHPHFHCQTCQRIICLEALDVPALDYPNGYLVQEVSMTVKGICAQCQP
jgi:Fur family ferric uptake transcriptional regulator